MITMSTYLLQTLFVVLVGVPAAPAETTPGAMSSPVQESEQAASQADGGVRFENVSRDTKFVLATFDGEKCGEMQARAQLELAPGASETVDSGQSLVCWCASTSGKVGNCADWSKAKPGKKVALR
jgi:hypothetical protein